MYDAMAFFVWPGEGRSPNSPIDEEPARTS
jgi:hypothetical protein